MPQLVIDDFSDATRWDAFQPDDTPSGEVALADDAEHHRYLPDATSMRVQASDAAAQHYLQRTLGPLNLSGFSELRLWYRASASSDGTPERPFRLRLQLGSAALAVGAPGNGWHRYLPAPAPGIWHFVRVELDDLHPQVRGALTTLRLTAVDATGGWTVWLDDLAASRPALIADVDEALLGLLHERLVIGGPVPAQVFIPGAAVPAEPWVRLTNYKVDFNDRRADSRRPRTDFTDTGYRLRGESVAYDLYYRVEGATTDRGEQAQMLQFVLDTLGHRGELLAGGLPLPIERVPWPPEDDEPAQAAALHYRVAARLERGPHQHVLPVLESTVITDLAP